MKAFYQPRPQSNTLTLFSRSSYSERCSGVEGIMTKIFGQLKFKRNTMKNVMKKSDIHGKF